MQTSIESKFDTKIKEIQTTTDTIQAEFRTTTNAIQAEQIQIKSMLVEILNAIKK